MPKQNSKYVLRSTYQKVVEENKKLLADIKVLTMYWYTPERTILKEKWQKKFKEEKEFNDFLSVVCCDYLKNYTEYNINSSEFIKPITKEGKRCSIINTLTAPAKKKK